MSRFTNILAAVAFFLSLVAAKVTAQQVGMLVLEQSISGRPVSGFTHPASSPNIDFNDDGVNDLCAFMIKWDARSDSLPFCLNVTSGIDLNQTWTIALPQFTLPDFGQIVVLGFYNVDGIVDMSQNNFKEILFAEKQGRSYVNPSLMPAVDVFSFTKWENTVLLGIDDGDGDGKDEIIIYDPKLKQIQIWGYQ